MFSAPHDSLNLTSSPSLERIVLTYLEACSVLMKGSLTNQLLQGVTVEDRVISF
jgi:hypothetical protein